MRNPFSDRKKKMKISFRRMLFRNVLSKKGDNLLYMLF